MKNKKRNFLLIWILALALLLNVLAFVPVVAEGGPESPRDLADMLKDNEDFTYTASYKIDNKEIEGDISLDGLSSLVFRLDFDIPDYFSLEMGDYFDIDLSGLSKIVGDAFLTGSERIDFVIAGDKSSSAAKYSVISSADDPKLKLRIEFDEDLEYLNTKTGRSAYVEFSFEIDDDGTDIREEIIVPINKTDNKTFTILRTLDGTSSISKSAEEYTDGDGKIVWIIDVNTVLDDLTEVSIIDTLPRPDGTGAPLEVEKVIIYSLKGTTEGFVITGDPIEFFPQSDNGPPTYQLEGDKLTVELGHLKKEAKRIIVTTELTEGTGTHNYKNEVKLHAKKDGTELEDVKADFTVTAGTVGLSKLARDGDSPKEIVWEITYIGDGETTEITDTLTLTSVDDSTLKFISLFFDEGSVKVNEAKFPFNEDDGIVTVSPSTGGLEIEFSGLPNEVGKTYTITYSTHSFFSGIGTENYTVKNKATHEVHGDATSSKSFSKNAVIEKEFAKVSQEIDEEDGKLHTYIDWEITINRNSEVWKNVVIKETIPAGFKFIEAKRDNQPLVTNTTQESGDDDTLEIVEITVVSGDDDTLNGPATITVTTELTNPDLEPLENESDIIGYNKAQIKWDLDSDRYGEGNGIGGGPGLGENTEDGYTETIEAPITRKDLDHKLTKTPVRKSIDSSGKTGKASWKLDYKTYTSSIPFNLVIKDSIDLDKDYHTYDPETFELVINRSTTISLDASENYVNWSDEENKTFSYKLVIDDDKESFTLTIVPGTNNGSENVYSSLFNKDANHIVLSYDTIVNFTELDDVKTPDKQGFFKNVLKNKASVTAGNLKTPDVSASQSFTEPFSRNGEKSVKDNNDRTYTWTAKLNYKSKTIPAEKTITDKLSDGQIYDILSLKIYEAKLTTGYDLEKVKVNGNEVLLGSDHYTVSFTPAGDSPTKMEITFTEALDRPIIIEYQTKAVGIAEAEYNNELKYNGMEYSSSVTRDYHDKFIDKELLNGRGTKGDLVVLGDVLDWEIDVNKSLSEIHNFVLTDTQSEGLILLPDSIKVLDGSTDVTNQFTKTTTDNTFTLKKDSVDERYTVKYSTLVVGSNSIKAVSNKVNIKGEHLEENFKTKDYSIVSASQAGGGGTAKDEFTLKVLKEFVGGDSADLKAEFNLIIETTISNDAHPIETIIPFTTDNAGQYTTIIKKNDYSKYYVQETGAPDGYLLSEEKIEINFPADNGKVITINVVNVQKTEVTVQKKWIHGNLNIQPVEVQLLRDGQQLDDTTYTVTLGDDEDNNWTHTWKNLEATDNEGNAYIYTVKEVEVPEHFKSSVAESQEGDEPNSFVITNTYKASGTWSPTVTKQLFGRGLRNNEFEFEMTPVEDTPGVALPEGINWPLTARNSGSGVSFGPITFNENHIDETFEFIIREVKPTPSEGGMRYDENQYKVVVGVFDDGDGNLRFETEYYLYNEDEPTPGEVPEALSGITFRNIYSAGNAWTPNVTKELVGRELKDEEFEFVLKGPQGNVIEKVKNDADGNVTFGYIAYNQSDIGGSYTYTIEEIVGDEPGMSYDTRSIKINVSISDAGGGVLNINASYPAVTTFVNRYSGPSGITVTANKVWKDLPSGWTEHLPTIWFKLYRSVEGKTAEAVPGLALQKLPAGVTQVSWNGLEKYDPDGKLYVYSVREVDENGDDYEPKYFDKTEKGLTVTNAFIKELVEGDEDFETEIDVTGHKVWKGVPKGQTVPTIWLKLYRHIEGGTPVAVPGRPIMELRPGVTQGTWKDLEKVDDDYNYYIYTVKEVDNKGNDYEPPHFHKTEEGLTVTNTHTPSAPVTGETLSVYTIMGAMLMALAALFLILTGRKRAKAK